MGINGLLGKIRRKDIQHPPPTRDQWNVEHLVNLHVKLQVPGGGYIPYEETGLEAHTGNKSIRRKESKIVTPLDA